ncbi:MAG: hypothetical protein VB130_01335 [Clostridium sp.]|nr:hypothetical protein [Clostridium sp.]
MFFFDVLEINSKEKELRYVNNVVCKKVRKVIKSSFKICSNCGEKVK